MSRYKHKILFVCVHNSARSQMAEAFLKRYGNDFFEAESAGYEAGVLNPFAIEVMKEKGIDISNNKTRSVFDLFKKGHFYNIVISVCDKATAERCPIFPGMMKRLEWSFPDPSTFKGNEQEILEQTRIVRDRIEGKVKEFINQAKDVSYWMEKMSYS